MREWESQPQQNGMPEKKNPPLGLDLAEIHGIIKSG